ncbi:MAG: NADPH-dependent assimilatory sulfite reductase hemoprotein subunit [Planctomycetota bacterium]
MSDEPVKLSAVEGIKTASNYLRGDIAQELVNGEPNLSKDSIQLIKHHGSYEQDDRDRRIEAKKSGVPGGRYYSYMVRAAIPGGRLTSAQLLAQLDLCDEIGNTTLRLTTRQGVQLHGILKENLKQCIRRINDVQLTTLAACGDVSRNVMCSPAPYKNDAVYDQLQEMAAVLAKELAPQTTAYHELWLTDETGAKTLEGGGAPKPDHEPLYGPTYLPRKFKLGVALPGDNSADIYSQDIGLMAVAEAGEASGGGVAGYNVLVGGGFGKTPSNKKTFAAVGQALGYVPASRAVDICKAVMKVQRDFGNRADRKQARMKYLVANWGLERFTQKVEEYYGEEIEPPREVELTGHDDGMGWHEQGDGRWFYGLNVENGRVHDAGDLRLKSALREVGRTLAPPVRITPHQGLIFCDIESEDRGRLEQILRDHGVPLTEDISAARRWSMACPALPMCGLAITESERFMPTLIDQLDAMLAELELADEVFTTRMTGCPNGCARPYNSDIGLVGRARGKYTLLLGGSTLGHRLNWVYKDLVPADDVVPTLKPVFERFKAGRTPGESFGDFCDRIGKDELLTACGEAA